MSFTSTPGAFRDDDDIRDINPFVREPRFGTDPKTFEEEILTVVGHLDQDKHWIGEALPVASREQAVSAGYGSSVGVSPFPARADHQHDHRTYYGYYAHGAAQSCPPGQTFINNLLHTNGRDMRASGSTQVFVPVEEGLWEWDWCIDIQRAGGGVFTGECNFLAFFNNGVTSRAIFRDSMANIATSRAIVLRECGFIVNTPSAGTNIQLAIQHNDVVNYDVFVTYMRMMRTSDRFSA